MNQTCRTCGQSKPLEDFPHKRSNPLGYSFFCKSCQAIERAGRTKRATRSNGTKRVAVRTSNGDQYIASRDLLALWETTQEITAAGGLPANFMFVGPSGSGKTEGAAFLASQSGSPFTKVDAASMTDAEAWFGTREVVVENGASKTVYHPSAFVTAVSQPGTLLIDEITRIRDEHRNILLPLLDTTREVTNPLTGETVRRHPECVVIMAGNIGLQFTGTYAVDPALMTRAYIVEFDYLSEADEAGVAVSRTGVSEDVAALLVRFANETRTRAANDPDFPPISTREVLAAALLVAHGLHVDTAVRVVVLNAAPTDGGAQSQRAALEMIWTGLRKGH